MNYYDILGVNKKDDINTIKKAYKKLAFKYHPDKHPGNHEYEEKFKKINEAYDTLSDINKRNNYDNVSLFGNHYSQYDRMNPMDSFFDDFFSYSMHKEKKKDSNGREKTEYKYTKNNEHNIFDDFFKSENKKNYQDIEVKVKLTKNEAKDGIVKNVFIESLYEHVKVRFPQDSIPGRVLKAKTNSGIPFTIKIESFSNKWDFEKDDMIICIPLEKIKDKSFLTISTITDKKIKVKIPEKTYPNLKLIVKNMGWEFKDGETSNLIIKII